MNQSPEETQLDAEKGALLEQVANLQSELLTARNDLAAAQRQVQEAQSRGMLGYQHQIRDQRLQIDALENEVKRLRTELEQAQAQAALKG